MRKLSVIVCLFLMGCGAEAIQSQDLSSLKWDSNEIGINYVTQTEEEVVQELNAALGFDLFVFDSSGVDIEYWNKQDFIDEYDKSMLGYADVNHSNNRIDSGKILINTLLDGHLFRNILAHELIHSAGHFHHSDKGLMKAGASSSDRDLSKLISQQTIDFIQDLYLE